LPPQALLQRLSNRLTLLRGGAGTLPARQQTLRNTIAWSYELLASDEQTLFRRLGVFVGGATVEGAEVVCNVGDDLTLDVIDGLQSLLDKSLLHQAEGADGEPRFTMLETIREYAREQLTASGDAKEMYRRHAAYYLTLAETAERHIRGTDQMAWLDRLEQEHDNLRAALGWYHANDDGVESELRLTASLWTFWIIHCHYTEARERYRSALARWQGPAPTPAYALALLGAAFLAGFQGDRAEGQSLGEASMAAFRALSDTAGLALALNVVAANTRVLGDLERAAALYEDSLALSRQAADPWCVGLALGNLGFLEVDRGHYDHAKRLGEEYLALGQRLQQPYSMAMAGMLLGQVAGAQGDYAAAVGYFSKSLDLHRQLRDTGQCGYVLAALGDVAWAQGNVEQAALHYADSLAIANEVGDKDLRAWVTRSLGRLALDRGDHL
jgi:tetratricopeptide (TPR) repeat protein